MSQVQPHRHPAWYGSVMGTGALALALAAQGATWDAAWLSWLAAGALVLASLLAIVLLPRYARRFSRPGRPCHRAGRPGGRGDAGHAARRAFSCWRPAGVASVRPWSPRASPSGSTGILLVIGAFLAVVMGTMWSAAILRATPGLEGVNGGWLIPPGDEPARPDRPHAADRRQPRSAAAALLVLRGLRVLRHRDPALPRHAHPPDRAPRPARSPARRDGTVDCGSRSRPPGSWGSPCCACSRLPRRPACPASPARRRGSSSRPWASASACGGRCSRPSSCDASARRVVLRSIRAGGGSSSRSAP